MELSPSAHVDTFARDNLPPWQLWPALRNDLTTVDYSARLNCATELLDVPTQRLGADRACLVGDDETWTYGELRERANQIAHVLVDDYGVVPGNRVLLRGPNNPWLVACWFAILKAGAIAVTVLPVLRSGELAEIADKAAITHALCDFRFADDLHRVGDGSLRVITYGGTDLEDVCQRRTSKPTRFDDVDTAADDVCLIAFTSGTTGKPKGCVHFHRDVLAIADTFSQHVLKPRPDDVFAGSPPLAFTFGLGALVVFPMRAGASSVLLEKPLPDTILSTVERQCVTVLFTAPTAYRGLLRKLGNADLSSLRRCVSAGEHLDKATWQAWRDATGISLIDGIGATEMLHIFISAADEDIRPGATGRAVPGFEARIVDEEGEVVRDGQPGLLAVRGPIGCRYLNDERQRDYVRDGWNITGDSYIRDADGYFWFQSRADDLIISSGYNIAAAEVEEAILRWQGVAEAAVVGVADADRGHIVTAYVVLTDGVRHDDDTAKQLQDFVKTQIAPYKYPRVVKFVDALPRTATGKVQRFKLRGHKLRAQN